jgi:hypothetical protein
MKKYDEQKYSGSLINNCFSFNKLLTNKGNAVSQVQGFAN